MAVITQFVVVREGVEKMKFMAKKEADAYDKMLDIADSLTPFILESELDLDPNTAEKMAFYLATNKTTLIDLLKGSAVKTVSEKKKPAKEVGNKEPTGSTQE